MILYMKYHYQVYKESQYSEIHAVQMQHFEHPYAAQTVQKLKSLQIFHTADHGQLKFITYVKVATKYVITAYDSEIFHIKGPRDQDTARRVGGGLNGLIKIFGGQTLQIGIVMKWMSPTMLSGSLDMLLMTKHCVCELFAIIGDCHSWTMLLYHFK